jgi:hypothetical protein
MNIKTSLLGLTITSAFLLMASCGSSESSDSGGAGKAGSGSSASGSSSTAGSSNNNNGGSSSSNAGSSNGNAGRNNGNGGRNNGNGGAANNGGFSFGGNFSFGGGGFDPADFMCNPKPETGAACTASTQPCVAGSTVCYCQAMKWNCIDLSNGAGGGGPGGFDPIECPAEAPKSGDACDGFGACQFGQEYCGCFGSMWMCTQ